MNITDLIESGWNYHETESERLACELENSNYSGLSVDQVAHCLQLSNHTIGEHLRDWSRARDFVHSVLNANPCSAKDSKVSCCRYVADYMNEDHLGATLAELDAMNSSEQPLGTYVAIKSMLAAALVGSGSVNAGFDILKPLNELASAKELPQSATRSLAVTNNNVASDLLKIDTTGSDHRELMLECATTALVFWKSCGTWTNEERALYLLALVYVRIENFEEAKNHAQAALRVIHSNGEELIDEAFIRLTAAQAHCGLGELESARSHIEKADLIAEQWSDDALRAEFEDARSNIRIS